MESYIDLFGLSFFNEFKEKIFTLILKDIHLLNNLDNKNNIIIENKPKKRKLEKNLNIMQDVKIQDVERLIALLQFLKKISIYRESFKLETSLEIDEYIIKFLLEQAQKSNNRTEKFNILLLECYNCLINSVIYSSNSTSPCLSYAIKIFSLGLNDFSVKIREICKDALIKCNSLIHPYLPSIYKSSSIQNNLKKSIQSKGKETVALPFENTEINSLNNEENTMEVEMENDAEEDTNNEDVQELIIEDKEETKIIEPKKTNMIKQTKKEEEHFIINEQTDNKIDSSTNNKKENLEVKIINSESETQEEESSEIKNFNKIEKKEETNISYDENSDNSDSDIELPDIVVDSDEQ
ncbi:hypothetical protein LY90DRAFT_672314 [Neocallimastix californiae]|uniref:Uncharacterized protein n=1 Tax=Neocallimastix californiae TaxID=1754190 RepID=A0A1Y2BYE4_9FUNG|nr:hypothetical protein LY90DRAFT_672314 [Neocallimastix californiae]|eukprot:ORY39756.1 hypothetical protein LY90DRAFT_672314 [Neocallimastix californiae]